MIRFASPLWFALLLVIAARIALLIADRRKSFGAFGYSSLNILPLRVSTLSRLSGIPFLLECAGLVVLVAALARPQRVTTTASDDRQGIDIVIALDSSRSMAAEDFHPRNRFTVAKELTAQFIERRVNDRIGIVTFGSRAATRVPITFDREAAGQMLLKFELGEHGDGTAIGHAIATAVNRLRNSKASSRVIILLTDGVNTAGSIDPATAAALAARYKIRLYTIGVASKSNALIPVRVQNAFTGEIETDYREIRDSLDEKILTAIADVTGGRFFRAVDADTLSSVLARVDQLERTPFTAPREASIEELYLLPLLAGLASVTGSVILGETLWFKLPG